jgi:hypothetical protein
VVTYLLDTDVLRFFFEAGVPDELTDALGSATGIEIAMVAEARDELRDSKKHGQRFRKWERSARLLVKEIDPESRAAELLNQLHPDVTISEHLGERASIAWAAMSAPAPVFVTNDGGAQRIALRELFQEGERLLGLHVWLRRLHEQAQLPARIIDKVEATAVAPKDRSVIRPTWWRTWRDALVT